MKWHFEDIPLLIHNLPTALYDLIRHEDRELVKNAADKLSIIRPNVNKAAEKDKSSIISIEKTIDPMAQRAAQNIGLLLHDYINNLPSFEVSDADAEKLLKHWKKVILEQPQRLSVAKHGNWHNENSKAFWQKIIDDHHAELGITKENFPDAWDDWQRASAAFHNISNINQLPTMKRKQWQDLVIRSRLYKDATKIGLEH